MSNYFYNMLPKEEFERIPYLPTMGEFVDWFTKEYADNHHVHLISSTKTARMPSRCSSPLRPQVMSQ